jgi:hypothetical protein
MCQRSIILREIEGYFRINENENTAYQNFWDVAEAGLEEDCEHLH